MSLLDGCLPRRMICEGPETQSDETGKLGSLPIGTLQGNFALEA